MPPIYITRQYLFVAEMGRSGPLFRYDPQTGKYLDKFTVTGPLDNAVPFDMEMGPDAWLYLLPLGSNQVCCPRCKAAMNFGCANPTARKRSGSDWI